MPDAPLILHLETGTEICSVALSVGNELLQLSENDKSFQHANVLIPFVNEVLSKENQELNSLHAISVGLGPGSYTGLRIGLSTAKGLCFGLGIPLIGISSLGALASGAHSIMGTKQPRHYCAMIDARRNEAYTAVYNNSLETVSEPTPSIIDTDFIASLEKFDDLIFCGNAVHKLVPHFGKNHPKLLSLNPSAQYATSLALQHFNTDLVSDLNFVSESYLKQPHITRPKNNLELFPEQSKNKKDAKSSKFDNGHERSQRK